MRIEFGEADGAVSPRARALADALNDAGIDTTVSTNVQTMLWSKFVLMTSNAALTSLSRTDTGVVRADPVMRAVYCAAMGESMAVGRAMGVALSDEVMERALAWLDTSAPIKASLAAGSEYAG